MPIQISIVTINFNNRLGLADTLRSTLPQLESPAVEWLIVDGGSSDHPEEVLVSVVDHPRVAYQSAPDRGIYDAMNKGIERATGELIVFMNSGDMFADPYVVSRVLRYRESSRWRWGYGCMRRISQGGDATAVIAFTPFRIDQLALGLRTIPHQAVYMERSLLQELGGFNADFGLAADQELLLRAAVTSKPCVWIDFLADFADGGVGGSRTSSEHVADMRRAVRDNNIAVHKNRFVDTGLSYAVQANFRFLDLQSTFRRRIQSH